MRKYAVSITCSWIEEVTADSMDDAVRKAEKKYRTGKGRIPREYVEVQKEYEPWCEIE